jgi:hypothetical protein
VLVYFEMLKRNDKKKKKLKKKGKQKKKKSVVEILVRCFKLVDNLLFL